MNNKQTILLVGLILLILGGMVWLNISSEKNNGKPSPTAMQQENNAAVVEVEGFAKNPYSYLNKEIQLKGVVSFVYPETQMLVLIDNKEYASCGVVTCAINQIPVSYAGAMPKVKDFVIATGKVSQSSDGKLLLQATELKPQ